jgi:hypothetical protein
MPWLRVNNLYSQSAVITTNIFDGSAPAFLLVTSAGRGRIPSGLLAQRQDTLNHDQRMNKSLSAKGI